MADLPNPSPDWISERMWNDFLTLPALPTYASLAKEFQMFSKEYKEVFDSAAPHREPLPGHWDKDLDEFQKMLVLKCVRADKIPDAMQASGIYIALNWLLLDCLLISCLGKMIM